MALLGPYGVVGCYVCGGEVRLDPRRGLRPEQDLGQPVGPALCCRCMYEHAGVSADAIRDRLLKEHP